MPTDRSSRALPAGADPAQISRRRRPRTGPAALRILESHCSAHGCTVHTDCVGALKLCFASRSTPVAAPPICTLRSHRDHCTRSKTPRRPAGLERQRIGFIVRGRDALQRGHSVHANRPLHGRKGDRSWKSRAKHGTKKSTAAEEWTGASCLQGLSAAASPLWDVQRIIEAVHGLRHALATAVLSVVSLGRRSLRIGTRPAQLSRTSHRAKVEMHAAMGGTPLPPRHHP